MSACPTLCRRGTCHYSVPLGPLHALGLARPNQKKYCPFSYGPSPSCAHHYSPRLFRASPEPSITNPRQSKSTFDWSKVEFRTRPLSRLDSFKSRFLSINPSSTWHLTSSFSIRTVAVSTTKSVLPGPHFFQSSSRITFRREFCCCRAIIVNHIPPLPEPAGRRQRRVAHCV